MEQRIGKMNNILGADSLIQELLDYTVKFKRPPIGLNYVVYAATNNTATPALADLEVVARSCNEKYLEHLLRRFGGPSSTVAEQLALWNKLLPKIHTALVSLDEELAQTGQGENVRVVLDVDLGGFFYTRIGSHALLFGATVDQAQVNNGRCDREMQQMASEIAAIFTSHGA
jgi:hypothetical protein